MYGFLADFVVFLHLAYVAYVLGGFLAILLGGLFRWAWVRGLRWRVIHLTMVLIVAFEGAMGWICPLTTLEFNLREKAGQTNEEQISFMGRLLRDWLFVEIPQEQLNKYYIVFGAIVLLSVVLVPPRRKLKQR